MAKDVDPFGRKVRLGRLGDEETTRRMLKVGVERVRSEGVRYSFDRLNFEALIAEAQVSRSAVYRKWPTRNHFYADLLRDLSQQEHKSTAAFENSSHAYVGELFLARGADLATPAGRRGLLVEIGRLGAQHELELLFGSSTLTVFEVLGATLQGLPERAQLRVDLESQLASIESRFVERMSIFYRAMLSSTGWQIRADIPEIEVHHLVDIGVAAVAGFGLSSVLHHHQADASFTGDPFVTGHDANWSHASVHYLGAILSLLEPNPQHDHDWSPEFIEAHLAAFREFFDAAVRANVIPSEEGEPHAE
ncbi:hypothetical protein JT358_09775 [Micrococcales bacterium 31B]|nr:hypothetical protein [Micrococcales bacterium 31B]